MNFILDTDVLSQLSKERRNPAVLRWIKEHDDSTLYLSAVTLAEIRFGVELVSKGRKRNALEDWLVNQLPAQFSGRIIPVERHIADLAGRILARSRKEGWELKANGRLHRSHGHGQRHGSRHPQPQTFRKARCAASAVLMGLLPYFRFKIWCTRQTHTLVLRLTS